MRRFGSPPVPSVSYRDRPGAYGIIWHKGRVLVTEESLNQLDIQLPGGGIDPGEGAVQALHREAMEETGWRIRVIRRLAVYQRYTFMVDYGFHARKICHIYLCAPVLRLGDPTEPHHRAFWARALGIAEELESPGDAAILRDVVRSAQGPLMR